MMLTGFRMLKRERGSALIIALLILVLLMIIGISATTTTTTDIQIAGNERSHKITFYAADAGIEVGRAVLNDLKVADSGNWDNLLAGGQLVGQDAGTTTLDQVVQNTGGLNIGPATFQLQVTDNEDLDGSNLVDTDSMIVLTSTANYRNSTVQIQAVVRYGGAGDQYAQEHYDTDSSGRASTESTAVANTERW
jgi:Tfp pilus assembly protein PilX